MFETPSSNLREGTLLQSSVPKYKLWFQFSDPRAAPRAQRGPRISDFREKTVRRYTRTKVSVRPQEQEPEEREGEVLMERQFVYVQPKWLRGECVRGSAQCVVNEMHLRPHRVA